jgi:hypothetical protein
MSELRRRVRTQGSSPRYERCLPRRIYQALEFAQVAHEVLRLPYERGLTKMDRYPPDRFTWLCDERGDAKKCVKIRDDKTGIVETWPHWRG